MIIQYFEIVILMNIDILGSCIEVSHVRDK
jgi:hypothetical protein